jgi:hypothetical protein
VIIEVNNLEIESYVDSIPLKTWGNYAEYLRLYQIEASIKELPLPTIKFSRQLPALLRLKLQQQGLAPAEHEHFLAI